MVHGNARDTTAASEDGVANGGDVHQSFDDSFWDTLVGRAYEYYLEGAAFEQAEEIAQKAVSPAIDRQSDSVLTSLNQTQPQMLRAHRRADAHLRRRLREHWEPALDSQYAMIAAAEECGSEYDHRHVDVAVAANDAVFEALTRLHACACRIAFEIHTLLPRGSSRAATGRA